MKAQYKIPMNWPRGQMFIEAFNPKKFHKHCRKHGIQLKTAGMMLPVGRK